jgi:hypothetical protein
MNKYNSATAFRTAIETRLAKESKKLGVDILRLRRDVAFDRLLVRLFDMPSPPWALKGGYAMQLRIDKARATKDIDLALQETRLFSKDEVTRNEEIHKTLVQQAGLDLGDFFSFIISMQDRVLNAPPEGGIRFQVDARLADRTFEKFLLDVGAGDVWSDPLEQIESSNLLEFAGVHTKTILVIPREQQFAEKLHAYTLPRPNDRPNSRVKDLVDMNLLINEGLNSEKLKSVLSETYQKRNTHPLSLHVAPPPQTWGATFTILANECGLNPNIDNAFSSLASYLKKL